MVEEDTQRSTGSAGQIASLFLPGRKAADNTCVVWEGRVIRAPLSHVQRVKVIGAAARATASLGPNGSDASGAETNAANRGSDIYAPGLTAPPGDGERRRSFPPAL